MRKYAIKVIERLQDGLETLKWWIEGEKDEPARIFNFVIAGVPIQAVREGRTWTGRIMDPEGRIMIERTGASSPEEAGDMVLKALEEDR